MLHGALVATIIGLAAFVTEHAARMLGRPVRLVWLVALAAGVTLSAARLLSATDAGSGAAISDARVSTAPLIAPRVGGDTPRPLSSWRLPALLSVDVIVVPRWLSALDRPLLTIWIASSLLWGLVLLRSWSRFRRERATWLPARLDGAAVYVSHDVGPALFGLLRYAIVVPSWVMELDAKQRALILAHEREHARAADPVLILFGAFMVFLQPWNPAVWVMFQRLRLAVETDCDARVLTRVADIRTYSELLINVGERTLAGAAPVTALAEPRSNLERRITLMTQHSFPRRLLHGFAFAAAGCVLAIAACQVPRPATGANQSGTASTAPARLTHDTVSGADARAAGQRPRTLVRLTSVGLYDTDSNLTILVYTEGRARVGLGKATPTELTDTLRLSSFPSMTLDVTESDVHIALLGPGRLRLEGEVTGGPAARIGASGSHIVLRQGGVGVRMAKRKQSAGGGP